MITASSVPTWDCRENRAPRYSAGRALGDAMCTGGGHVMYSAREETAKGLKKATRAHAIENKTDRARIQAQSDITAGSLGGVGQRLSGSS
jgi:predicted aconitase